MPNSVRIGVSAPGAKQASSEMDNLRDKFAKLKSQGAQGIAIGAGAAATAKAFDLVGTAINGVVGFLGDAATAAREDEESQSRLRASLQANIEGWDGNTDAIEKVIAARQKLGFTDEEQRTSLAILVAATHDYNKALEVQRTAMDLARLKGIGLAEASEALTKVEGGQFRALKSLGIVLKEGATATDALAAVQKVATGQADAFAATNAGKVLASQIKVSEAMEKLGYVIMPALADAAVVVSDAISFVADNMNVLQPVLLGLGAVLTAVAIPALISFAVAAAAAAVAAAPILLIGAGLVGLGLLLKAGWDMATQSSDKASEALAKTAQAASDAGVAYGKTAQGMADDARESAHLTGQANIAIRDGITKVGTAAQDAAQEAIDAYTKIQRASHKTRFALIDDARAEIEGAFDEIINADKLAATNAEIAANRRILASAKATAAEKRDARTAIHELNKDRFEALADLAEHGKTSSKVYKAGVAGLLKELRAAHGAEADQIRDEIRLLNLLAQKAQAAKTVIGQTIAKGGYIYAPGGGGGTKPGKAAGGPVERGMAYTVGEAGSETFVPDQDGTIIPHGTGTGSPMAGNITFAPTVVVQGIATPATKQAIITELGPLFAQWLRSQGWKPA